jgi:tetraacyldisaccharide 4'-kinase
MKGPFEFLYYLGYKVNTALDKSNCNRLPVPVISIGNITTGGTGKTPMTIALATEARKRGLRPCVLTRGYGGKAMGPLFVSLEMYVEDVGDEALMMAERMSGIPVVKGVNRYESGLFALENLHDRPDLFILDDGFQHRKIHRDIDIVLINSRNPFGSRRLLPFGRLREPLSELERAGVFVLTKCDDMKMPPELYDEVRTYNSDSPVYLSRHTPSFVCNCDKTRNPMSWLRGKNVFAFSGIGEPESFVDLLERSGANVVGVKTFRDHYAFSLLDLEKIRTLARHENAEWLITTEKDIMRLRKFKGEALEELLFVGLDLEVEKDFYDHVLNNIQKYVSAEDECSST